MKGKVIVTSGATREPIDSVRFISNFSSGRTGAAICEALAARGFQVIQVAGVESTPATGVARRETFTDHITNLFPTKEDFKRMFPAVLRGTALGSALGILPGGGASLAA